MKLKPSARAKRRYLLVENADADGIKKAILDYIGVLGWARAAPEFVKREGRIILVINREEINNVRAAVELSPLKARISRVSGTLKGLGK